MSIPKRVFAPAKINLFLHIGDRRADGYHALKSLVTFADIGDELAFEPAEKLSLTIEGPFASPLADESDNLILRAARGVSQLTGAPISRRIVLTKNLPVASGIGGGSADAAAALRAFLPDRNKDCSIAELAKRLGADVPVCLFGKSAFVSGIGEHIERIELPQLHAVLVNPGVALSTRDVFTALGPRSGTDEQHWPTGFATSAELIAFLKITANDLETPALGLAPVIGSVLNALNAAPGIELARMSGSGATCFGLFHDAAAARHAADAITRDYPDWWVTPTTLTKAT